MRLQLLPAFNALAWLEACAMSAIPLNATLCTALAALKATRNVDAADRIIHSERDIGMSPGAVQVWFHRLYASLGFQGASSHSGRRTFVTRCAKKIIEAGGSLRDVQELAGHASLATTQRYIQGDSAAKRRVVDLCPLCTSGDLESDSRRHMNPQSAIQPCCEAHSGYVRRSNSGTSARSATINTIC